MICNSSFDCSMALVSDTGHRTNMWDLTLPDRAKPDPVILSAGHSGVRLGTVRIYLGRLALEKTFIIQLTGETVKCFRHEVSVILGTDNYNLPEGSDLLNLHIRVCFDQTASIERCVGQYVILKAVKKLISRPRTKLTNFKWNEFFTVYLMFKNIADSCVTLIKSLK